MASEAPRPAADTMEQLGIAPAAARLIRYFALRPDARPHMRQVQRVLGLGGASLQRELERLVGLGLVERSVDGRHVRYHTNETSPLWAPLRLLITAAADPIALLRDALLDVPGVEAAFVFGSFAHGQPRATSDVDLFILEGRTFDRQTFFRRLTEVGLLSGREVNAQRYTEQRLAERLSNPEHPGAAFVREVLAGPKRWVAGSADVLTPLATAAGITMPERGDAAA
ncbi:MAG: nucleotidyltransferase domain-containing protein [Gemmatimonadaceae bacterium]|nr:nucleotidyltransferase domain-containing protein [Gemmatimonadaceae bacterium]